MIFLFLVSAIAAAARPNILLILADDLGYSDLGCYGGEIETPNLDGLAKNGLRFTQFYNTGRCWPTRGALLTGYYAQQIRRDKVPGVKSGGGGVRPDWAVLLPTRLKAQNYRCYHSGKWHIDGMPLQNGFDRSYYLKDQSRFFSPKVHFEDDKKLPPVERGTGYFGTVKVADKAIAYLQQHAKEHADKPFFTYLAFAAPHFPLHALPEDIAKYRDRYLRGWDAVRAERRARQKELKLPGKLSAVQREVGPPYDFPKHLKILGDGEVNRPLPWDALTETQQEFQAAKMAIHAAMIDRMDREIGRVIGQLKAMKAFDDTLILFLSDNGASAEIMVRADGHDPEADPGSAATYLCLGPGWSTVCNTPFRYHKTWVHEGGIATPFIAHWPKGIAARGELRTTPAHVIDFVPTALELCGAPARAPVPPLPGKSLAPAFAADTRIGPRALWWMHDGHRALRVGDLKVVKTVVQPQWELFDLSVDRAETEDLAGERTGDAEGLAGRWENMQQEFIMLARGEPAKPVKPEAPLKAKLILPGETFHVEGRPCFVLLPAENNRAKPQPWIWYSPTLPGLPDGAEKWMHEQFINAGVAVAGIDVGESYGSPGGRAHYAALHREMVKRGYAMKPVVLGRSRGGLQMASWAGAHPDKVAGIAGIYPVFDVTSYPGLKRAAPAYGLAPHRLEAQLGGLNPVFSASALARAKVPVFIIHGDSDRVVPLEKNSGAFAGLYEKEGRKDLVTLVVTKGQGHNMWQGFFRCQELIDFAIARAKAGARAR